MKIGLLTYHHSANVGAMLQTYATCKALETLGHDVVLVDVRQPERVHSGLSKYVAGVVNFKRDIGFRSFRRDFYPQLTRRYSSVDELQDSSPEVDCLVVGSDQTWNPDISKEMVMAYFLDFGPDNARRFSYASSFGLSAWPNGSALTGEVCRALKRFDGISVREKTGLSILEDTFGLTGTVVVDPTMLFGSYDELTGVIPQRNELLCYKLERNADFYRNIGAVKDLSGMPARLLNNSYPVKGLRYIYPPTPREWIRRIAGAGFVLTDSFHGTVFSLLYKRNFAAVRNGNGKDSRIVDLLESIGLGDRVYDSVAAMASGKSWLAPIDYTYAEKRISAMREASWEYLRSVLK